MRTEKTFKSVVLVVMLFALWMALCGCGSLDGQRVVKEAKNYNAIAPRHRAYLKADPELAPTDKDDYLGTVDTWRDGIAEAGKGKFTYNKETDRFEFTK